MRLNSKKKLLIKKENLFRQCKIKVFLEGLTRLVFLTKIGTLCLSKKSTNPAKLSHIWRLY
ncbi:hypothetical protein C4553_02565 [Candidatus Parcubacteria bacterium]|nr:MAG: hypothetical protein C4553_02565 [Candidatus Parcubacteria bacterium]